MNKQTQKKFIEINHAISGYHGDSIRNSASLIYEARKQILKRLERKKKLAPAITEELYIYLEKYPEQKLGLHQQSFKKKKSKMLQGDQKGLYPSPAEQIQFPTMFQQGYLKKVNIHVNLGVSSSSQQLSQQS